MDTKSKVKIKKIEPKNEINENEERLKSQLARTLADYDNLVKRVERDRSELFKMASINIINKLLPVLDNLESANNHLKDAGLAISIVEFKNVLKDEGLTEIKPEIGSIFNEVEMEAIEIVDGEVENSVSEVVLTGWKYSDNTIIRHAKVKVFKS